MSKLGDMLQTLGNFNSHGAVLPAEMEERFEGMEEHLKIGGEEPEQGMVTSITEGTRSMPVNYDAQMAGMIEQNKEMAKAIALELAYYMQHNMTTVRTDPNYAGRIRIRSYSIANSLEPIRILNDQPIRGLTTITLTSGGPVSIGQHKGIIVGGTDTFTMTSATASQQRFLRTMDELWVVAGVVSTLDVIEEFD